LLRHLLPEDIEEILPCLRTHTLAPGEILFRKGDPGDALYIVAKGDVDVIDEDTEFGVAHVLAKLGPGKAFGEMALLSGSVRTAMIRAGRESELPSIE